MKHLFQALIVVGGLAAAQAYACDYPAKPGKFPDGNTASKDEMIAAKKLVQKYNDDITAYLDCLKGEFDATMATMANAPEDKKADMQKKQGAKEDAAMKEVTDVTEEFNVQLRAWKAKNQPEKKSG